MTTEFNPTTFKTDYPQFDQISDDKLTNTFIYEAKIMGQIVSSLFTDDNIQYYWLCVTLAHILTCETLGLTGRLSSVTQGSESANFDMKMPTWSQYWEQTVYGQKIMLVAQEYLSGGHYISDGQQPYLSNSMNGSGAIGWVQI